MVVRVEVAGVRRESLNVVLSADRRTLSIRGARAEEHIDQRKKTRYHQLEVYFGSFERDVILPRGVPVNADKLRATYRGGFLLVTLPKAPQAQPSKSVTITEGKPESHN